MKNLLKSLVACAAFLTVASASAGTLYWQVQNDDVEFDEAWLMVKDSEGNTTELQGVAAQSDKHSTAPTQTTVNDYENSQYTFFVELGNYSTGSEDKNWVVATGPDMPYDDLASNGYIATGLDAGTMPLGGGINMGVGAAAVPEPTSGLLLLIGGAMLALRRRRQQ